MKIPDIKLAAISWKANANANPNRPAAPSMEVTAVERLRTVSAANKTINNNAM